jgi:hypothetical protein
MMTGWIQTGGYGKKNHHARNAYTAKRVIVSCLYATLYLSQHSMVIMMKCECGGTLTQNGLSGKFKDRQRFICNQCRKTSTWIDGMRQTRRGRPLKAYQPFLIDWEVVKHCVKQSVEHSVKQFNIHASRDGAENA